MITSDTLVSDVVRESPQLAGVFESLGIDYCCGGKVPLSQACAAKGLDPSTVAALLNTQTLGSRGDNIRVDGYATTDLVRHIVDTHHTYLRRELPRLQEMTRKVARSHSKHDPRMTTVAESFELLVQALASHLDKEESEVFPRILAAGEGAGPTAREMDELYQEHESVGRLLSQLRGLTDGYEAQSWACPTTLAMLRSLKDLEADTHLHVHKENNILLPRVEARPAASL